MDNQDTHLPAHYSSCLSLLSMKTFWIPSLMKKGQEHPVDPNSYLAYREKKNVLKTNTQQRNSCQEKQMLAAIVRSFFQEKQQ